VYVPSSVAYAGWQSRSAHTLTIDPTISDKEPETLDPRALRAIIPEIEQVDPSLPPSSEKRFQHELLPTAAKIQANKTAHPDWMTHKVEWRWTDGVDPNSNEADKLDEVGRGSATGDGEFVRSLKLGDVITVWAKSRFPGWVNNVASCKIDVYFAV
jgi:hypothetical protein